MSGRRGTPGKHTFACKGDKGKALDFSVCGRVDIYKEPVSAMMSREREKFRLTQRTRCKGSETHQSVNMPDLSANSRSKKA